MVLISKRQRGNPEDQFDPKPGVNPSPYDRGDPGKRRPRSPYENKIEYEI